MPEYLSVGFYRTSLPNGAGESLTVLINGKVADLKQYRVNQGSHHDGDVSWGKLKKISKKYFENAIRELVSSTYVVGDTISEMYWQS
jgi:hypothetical protein